MTQTVRQRAHTDAARAYPARRRGYAGRRGRGGQPARLPAPDHVGALGAMVLGGVGAFVAYLLPRRSAPSAARSRAGTIDDIKAGDVVRVREGKFYLSRVQGAGGPTTGKGVVSWRCTGSASTWAAPCPGSPTRTSAAIRRHLPLPVPRLDLHSHRPERGRPGARARWTMFGIAFDGRKIIVDTGKGALAAQYEPKQATPVANGVGR